MNMKDEIIEILLASMAIVNLIGQAKNCEKIFNVTDRLESIQAGSEIINSLLFVIVLICINMKKTKKSEHNVEEKKETDQNHEEIKNDRDLYFNQLKEQLYRSPITSTPSPSPVNLPPVNQKNCIDNKYYSLSLNGSSSFARSTYREEEEKETQDISSSYMQNIGTVPLSDDGRFGSY